MSPEQDRYVFPMSLAQERLWFLSQLDPDGSAYNLSSALELRGVLDVAVLERCLAELVSRHESLRTTFDDAGGLPWQIVHASAVPALERVELAALPGPERAAALSARLREHAARPFDLRRGPLLRLLLVRLAEQEHVLLWSLHHAVFDGWSTAIVQREFAALYAAFACGQASPLPPLALQYVDFAHWQRTRVAGATLAAQLDYWRAQLADAPVLELPTDHPRPGEQAFRGARHFFQLPAQATSALAALARGEGTTLFALLLAGLKALLARLSGAAELCVATPMTNRDRLELEPIVGCFANTVVLRSALGDDPSFRQLLARVSGTVRAAQANAEVPFHQVVEVLAPARDPSRNALSQVLFALQPQAPAAQVAGLQASLLDLDSGGSQFDLSLEIALEDERLACAIEYDTELFEATTIERWGQYYGRLLAAAVAQPEARLSALELLSPEERRSLARFSGTAMASGAALPAVHRLFERRAEAQPAATAVLQESVSLSYGELERRSNQVAHWLLRQGVAAEARVGVCLRRSPAMIVSVLGILKAGAAYVPIDPRYPQQRMAELLADAEIRAVLTDAESCSQLPEQCRGPGALPTLALDASLACLAAEPDERVSAEPAPQQAAYVLYTSGSTGAPKGVVIPHGSLSSFIAAAAELYQIDEHERVLQFAALGFDASVEEIFPCLTRGATLVLRTEEMLESVPRFFADCERWGVTAMELPTMYFHRVAAALAEGLQLPACVRLVFIGGEAALPEPVRIWQSSAGTRHVQLLNTYGPAEATVTATSGELSRASAAAAGPVSIGKPLCNTRAYVLDAHGALVPPGVAGELYLGGQSLARGYLGRPRLTAECFVPDPFSTVPGARLYRTGDRARWRADGELVFLGRVDHQIKLNGFRIEPGEIEARLVAQPGVREAIVLVLAEGARAGAARARLVAYVAGDGLSSESLRQALMEQLPEYMVPAHFVLLAQLPHTTNGKVDRRALPVPPLESGAGRAPESHAELALAQIWQRLLGLEQVSAEDNFFELGGDSILALQIISQAREAGLELTARQIFRHQTIAELARAALPARPARAPARGQGEAPLTPIQRWFFAQSIPARAHYNQSLCLELEAPTSGSDLLDAVCAVVEHHDAFRLRFALPDGAKDEPASWRQSHAAHAEPRLERVDLAGLAPEAGEAEWLRRAEALQRGLELGRGPLIAALHGVFGQGRPERLLCIAHHLVVDAVSWRILLGDLEVAYAAVCRRQPVRLASPTLAYADWARSLSERVPVRPLAPARSEWGTEGNARLATEQLSPEQTQRLLEAAALQRRRVDELLLAALGLALHAHSPGRNVDIELESHGRDGLDGLDVSRTVGWFTALRSVRLQLAAGLPVGQLLGQVSAALERATPAEPGAAPAVSFNYLGAWDDVLRDSTLFAALREGTGTERDPAAQRSYELELDAVIVSGRLRVTFSHAAAAEAEMAQLRQSFRSQLQRLVEEGRATRRSLSAADVPLAALSDAELAALLQGQSSIVDVYPVTPVQQGMLFHSLWEPGAGAYVEQITCRLSGSLDPRRLERAWQRVVDRHPVLRTRFIWQNVRSPLQLVEQRRELLLERHDLARLSPEQQSERLRALLAADRERGFALAQGPLLRVSLIRLAAEEHVVLWSHHHIILDGWSSALVLQEVFAAYRTDGGGEQGALQSLPERVPYREHVAWLEQQRGSAPSAAEREAFFRRLLGGFAEPTPLPFERVRRRTEQRGHGVVARTLSAALTRQLEAFARERRVTLSTLLAGAWALVLSRAARQEQVLFGITVSGRSAPLDGVENMIGLFINTLPLAVQVPPGARAGEWLAQLLALTAELGAHEHAELVRLRGASAIPAGQPLFESLFVFENYPSDARVYQSVAGLAVRDITFHDQTNYALTLSAQPGPQLELRLAYERQRFAGEHVELLLELVQNLLQQLLARPDACLGQLPLEPPAQQRGRLEAENRTAVDHGEPRHVPQLIAAQAEQTPDAIALYFDDRTLSYGALDARANQLAHALRVRGVGPESLVAIALERSLELVVALLAVLKAGAAYVPIDPEYPEERIRYVLQDARASVLLSVWPIASRLPASDAQLLCLDVDRRQIEGQPTRAPAVAVHGDNLAYTIYTSGSTGRPKGAGNTHDGLRNRLLWMQRYFGLEPSDRVLQKTPISFDVSVWEFFWPLCVGAGLVLARPGEHRDGERLIELIEARRVTTLHFVPPMLQAFLELVDAPARARLASLRRIICSGEALGGELARRCIALLPAELHNLYGPTEASIDVSAWRCTADDAGASLPIGVPVDNTQLYVLDGCGHPVPRGLVGELYIGGVQLARGYHARPGLTAERFVASGVGDVPGARLYRTGDLARQREGGVIEFVGRVDHQVKIRGFRIELGEIEARLAQHAAVREAVVIARDGSAGSKQLVAYVAAGTAPEQGLAAELQAWCAATLPAYMVPAVVVPLERLPLSPNGKLDRRALPSPEASRLRRAYVPPRSAAEQALAQIWSEVLSQPQVGAEDDFFELGGDSITTLQVIARASSRGLSLTPKLVFEHPRLSALALAAQPSAPASTMATAQATPEAATAPPAPRAQLSADEWQDLLSELES